MKDWSDGVKLCRITSKVSTNLAWSYEVSMTCQSVLQFSWGLGFLPPALISH